MINKLCSKNVFLALVFAVGFSTFLFSLSPVQAGVALPPDVTDGDHPLGYNEFQFNPPFNNDNPFDTDTLGMIEEGLDLFLNEDFDGNGRACGSCHIPEAQYNVLPGDIQTMTPAQKDLVLGGTNLDLENMELTEKFALFNITEEHSADSEGERNDPVGPFRASMPLLSNGLGLTTINFHVCRTSNFTWCKPGPPPTSVGFPGNPVFPGCTETPLSSNPMCVATVPMLNAKPFTILPNTDVAVHDGTRDVMIGWGGNGAIDEMFEYEGSPGAGDPGDCEDAFTEFADDEDLEAQLALFALTAVKTHFPKTMERVPGVDFRCPTVDELRLMAKHQIWLGRRYELDITELDFVTSVGNEGRDLFLDRNAGCSGCHINAGANDNQGRLKLGPFDVIPPLTDDQEILAAGLVSGEYCPEEAPCSQPVSCVTDADCDTVLEGSTCVDTNPSPVRVSLQCVVGGDTANLVLVPDDTDCRTVGSHCSEELVCVDADENVILVDDLLDALDELMPRSGMGANKTSRSGTQFLESLVDGEVAADFPFDPGDGALKSGGTQGGFNIQPAFQAAPKTHLFHQNAIEGKLENAIAHYFTPNFDNSQGGNAIRDGFRCGKAGPVALADLGGPEAIDKMGYFLRSLFAVYSITDCERFMNEAIDRINAEMEVELPLTHCQFELNDLQTALEGSNIQTAENNILLTKGRTISRELTSIIAQIKNIEKGSDKKKQQKKDRLIPDLEDILENLVGLRNNIATTPEIED